MNRSRSLRLCFVAAAGLVLACGGKDPATDGSSEASTTTGTDGGETTGAAEETSSDTGESTTTTDTGAFLTTDMAGVTCGTFCDIWNPGDCPEGEKCTAVGCDPSGPWDSNVCRPVMGTKVPGDVCLYMGDMTDSGYDDCAEGSLCYDRIPPDDNGICVEFCTGSSSTPMCTMGSLCRIVNDGVLPICLSECDPLSPACPNPDNLCLPSPSADGFQCVINASGDDNPAGTGCQYNNSCNAGLLCVDAALVPDPECLASGLSRCCTEVCDINAPNICSGMALGQECLPYFEVGAVPPGYESVGVCGIPGAIGSLPRTSSTAGVDLLEAVSLAPPR